MWRSNDQANEDECSLAGPESRANAAGERTWTHRLARVPVLAALAAEVCTWWHPC